MRNISDKDDPGHIIAVSHQPILVPEASYEVQGFFTCGTIEYEEQIHVYYGAADEHIALAIVETATLVANLLK